MVTPRRRLWLGAAGTAVAFGVLRSARELWGDDVFIVAADTNPSNRVVLSVLADAYEQVPPVDSEEFPAALIAGLVRHGIDTYMPILDGEIAIAARLRGTGQLPAGVAALAPSNSTVSCCNDKLATAEWLLGRGLPSPPTAVPSKVGPWAEGVVIKPRAGWGSHGVATFEDVTNLDLSRYPDEVFVAQRRCRPPELTLDNFRGRQGGRRVVCRERLEVKAGVCTKARLFDDRELADLGLAVGDGLDLEGTYCIQVMRSPAGEGWEVIDINPRPGAGTRMSSVVGVDLLAATLADAWRMDCRAFLPSLNREFFVARQYDEYVL